MRVRNTPEQLAWLREAYQRLSLAELAPAFNAAFHADRTEQQIRSTLRNHRIRSGRTGRFYKGQSRIPGSGAKGPNRTSFKKGNMSGQAQKNYVPIGTTRVSKDGYLERKVTDDHPVPARRWVAEHRLIWEASNGPVPDGHAVVFLDGDKGNLSPDNLRCVPRAALAHLNQRHRKLNQTSGELRKAAVLTSEIMARASGMQAAGE